MNQHLTLSQKKPNKRNIKNMNSDTFTDFFLFIYLFLLIPGFPGLSTKQCEKNIKNGKKNFKNEKQKQTNNQK